MSTEMMGKFPVSPPEALTAAITVPFWITTTAMIQRTNCQKNGMEIRKPAMLMIRQETGFRRKKKVNSTATSTAPGTNWYPWRKVGKPDITSMINRAI